VPIDSPCTVAIEGSAQTFSCEPGTYVLDAAIAAGIRLPYNCRGGACGTCKAEVLEGTVQHGWVMGFAITDTEVREGKCLVCSCRPTSQRLVLRMVNHLPSEAPVIAPREYSADVLAVHRVSESVCQITLQLDAEAFRFDSGMHVDVLLDGIHPPRPYSIATPAKSDGTAPDGMIDLLVARHQDGYSSVVLHERIRVGDTLQIRGPYGTFTLPPTVDGSILMLAGGTGLAPLISMAGSLLERKPEANVELWLSVRTRRDVLRFDLLQRLVRRHGSFRFRVFLSREDGVELPHGWARGRIPDHLIPVLERSRFSHLFISGSPGMVEACRRACLRAGVPPESIQCEAYESRLLVPGTGESIQDLQVMQRGEV